MRPAGGAVRLRGDRAERARGASPPSVVITPPHPGLARLAEAPLRLPLADTLLRARGSDRPAAVPAASLGWPSLHQRPAGLRRPTAHHGIAERGLAEALAALGALGLDPATAAATSGRWDPRRTSRVAARLRRAGRPRRGRRIITPADPVGWWWFWGGSCARRGQLRPVPGRRCGPGGRALDPGDGTPSTCPPGHALLRPGRPARTTTSSPPCGRDVPLCARSRSWSSRPPSRGRPGDIDDEARTARRRWPCSPPPPRGDAPAQGVTALSPAEKAGCSGRWPRFAPAPPRPPVPPLAGGAARRLVDPREPSATSARRGSRPAASPAAPVRAPGVLLVDVRGRCARTRRAAALPHSRGRRRGPSPGEVFTLGTRLTRVTRELATPTRTPRCRRRRRVPDWSGAPLVLLLRGSCTAGGSAAAPRAVCDPVDGWERDDPRRAGQQMRRLSCRPGVWCNRAKPGPLRALAGGWRPRCRRDDSSPGTAGRPARLPSCGRRAAPAGRPEGGRRSA